MRKAIFRNSIGISVATILIFAFTSLPLRAQGVEQAIDLTIQATPSNPEPGRSVTLEAVSFGLDLTSATLTWTYGGKVIASGVGKTRVSVIAPQGGSSALVNVSVSASGISPVSATTLLNPGSVDILWEALDTSTPPFYKGRTLLAPGGIFHVVAVSTLGAPTQSSVTWSRNSRAVPGASGTGRSSALFENTIFSQQEAISAVVSGGTFQGSGTAMITPVLPSVVAYQKKEGFINYHRGATNTLTVSGPGAVIRLEPYFFSVPKGVLGDLIFKITSNGEQLYGSSQPNEVRLARPDDGTAGTFSVDIKTVTYSLQNISRTFTVLFQ